MTRQEQETIVINKLEEHLQTLPNIREKIGNAFRNWFSMLIQQEAAQNAEVSQPVPEPNQP